ncbi:MAG: hypothetical protein ABI693_33365 [Bryobacteraceae bacterium]
MRQQSILALVIVAAVGAVQATPLNPTGQVLARWTAPSPVVLQSLRDAGITTVFVPFQPGQAATAKTVPLIADLPQAASLSMLSESAAAAKRAGYVAAAVTATGDLPSFRQFLNAQKDFIQFVYLKPEQLDWDVSPAHAVLESGTWPGLHDLDTGAAGASERPWLDANLHLYEYLRAFYPHRLPLLSYHPKNPSASLHSVETALAEAFAGGGNTILEFPDSYRQRVARSDPRALAALRSLGKLAAFIKAQRNLPRVSNGARTAVLSQSLEQAEEILNLAYRNNLAPRALPVTPHPLWDTNHIRIVAAVNLNVEPDTAKSLVEFLQTGGKVLTAPATAGKPQKWWETAAPRQLRTQGSSTAYAAGKGEVYVYPEPVSDPSEFALDLMEVAGADNVEGIGLRGLDFRVWNTGVVLGTLYQNPGEKIVLLTSYGSEQDYDLLLSVRGEFSAASYEDTYTNGPRALTVMQRPGRVELDLKTVRRLGIVRLKEKTQ